MHVLIAEDDAVSRRILEAYLRKWGHTVVVTTNGAEAWNLLQQPDAPRLALLDWMMPDIDGVEVCRRLRSRENAPFTYVILLTAKSETNDIVTALDSGADDYLVKPYNALELRSRIGAGERILRLQRDLETANAELTRLAQTDFLTQVYNRSAIMTRLVEEFARSVRGNSSVAVYMLDVDHFKKINDNYGHASGDNVLIEVARRLREQCRPYDAMGRFGGEEFVLIAPGIPETEMAQFGERIRHRMAVAPVHTGTEDIGVSVSIGGVWVPPGIEADPDAVLKRADELLYQAKREGRDRVAIANFEPVAANFR